MGLVILIIGVILCLIGGVQLLIKQFQVGILWGIGGILLPIVSLVFVIMHWEVSKKPFLIQVVGIILILIGVAISPNNPTPLIQ